MGGVSLDCKGQMLGVHLSVCLCGLCGQLEVKIGQCSC